MLKRVYAQTLKPHLCSNGLKILKQDHNLMVRKTKESLKVQKLVNKVCQIEISPSAELNTKSVLQPTVLADTWQKRAALVYSCFKMGKNQV